MSHPARRSSNRPTRRQRVDRAYRLTLATGAVGLATVAAFVLALITSFSFGWFILLAVITAVLVMMTSRSVGR